MVENRSSSSLIAIIDFVDIDRMDDEEANLWFLLLGLFPITCVFGNLLVVLAVAREKNLKTWTNYLLVSLATADMLVALLVMPFSIYLTVNRLKWYLSEMLCDLFCAADVAASTSSIVHLVSISVDRFYAVAKHVEYHSKNQSRRIYGTIIFCWTFSLVVGVPLGLGLNEGRAVSPHHCGIINPNFMLYSSIFAFFIPCSVMIIMYSVVFHQLRKRLRAVRLQEMAAARMVNFGDHLGSIIENALGANGGDMRRTTMSWAMPFIRSLEETLANVEDTEDISDEDIEELTTIFQSLGNSCSTNNINNNKNNNNIETIQNRQVLRTKNGECRRVSSISSTDSSLDKERRRDGKDRFSTNLSIFKLMNSPKRLKMIRNLRNRGATGSARQTKTDSENDDEDVGDDPTAARRRRGDGGRPRLLRPARFRPFSSRIRSPAVPKTSSSIQTAKEKILALKDRGLEILMKFKSTQGRSIRKEAKATKLVATVLLVFLLCYVPFFTTNIIKVVKLSDGSWTELMEQIFIVFTWLGYLNSCLNPVIYSIFNQRFREAFKKILCAPLRDSESSSDTIRLRRSGRNETVELCETPKFSGFKSNHLPFTKLNAVTDVKNSSKFPLSKERRRRERKVLDVLDEEISAAISQHKINIQECHRRKTKEKENKETTAQRKQIQKAANGKESSISFSSSDDSSYKIISNNTQLTSFIDEEDEDCSL